MSKSQSEKFNKKLILMVTSCTLLICAAALILSLTKTFPFPLIIEIATTSLAILMSIGCLIHVYREHKTLHDKELKMKKKLTDKIANDYVNLPTQNHIEQHIEDLLEKHSSAQLRFDALQTYYHNQTALDSLIDNLNQEYLDEKVLVDLGLNWERKPAILSSQQISA